MYQETKYCCFCLECDFRLEKPETIEEIKRTLTDLEGALVSDGEGGYISICPKCKTDSLILTD